MPLYRKVKMLLGIYSECTKKDELRLFESDHPDNREEEAFRNKKVSSFMF